MNASSFSVDFVLYTQEDMAFLCEQIVDQAAY
jgi:hypothetical protein